MNEPFARTVERSQMCIERGLSLFRDGFLPECHEFMIKALRLQLDAWGGLESVAGPEQGEPPGAQEQGFVVLERAGYRRIDRLRAAARADEPASSIGLAHTPAPDFDWIWAEVERLTRFSTSKALTPRARTRRRWRRSLLVAALGFLALLICYRLWGRPRAQASAIHSEPYPANNAVDGLEATEWLLPDRTSGWVDVMLPAARTVHRVRLVNAHNVFNADRATRAVHVTAFSRRGPAVSVDGAFAAFSENRSLLELPLEAHDVTRIRVEVLSYFKLGGGLAEVEIE
ncbi:MAG TPA: hypothetical protein VIK01_07295 [Polyangiaceae bacterium]